MTHAARRNRLLNTLEMRQRKMVMESLPYSVQLEVTTKCNLACIMCARDKYHGRGSDLTDDVLEPVLNDILPFAQDIIVSSFGEPMLYPRLGELFGRIDPDSGLELGFFTNFLLMNEPLAEKIIHSGVAYINASIDGASKESYEAIRKGGKWEILLEKLQLFQDVKDRLGSATPRVNLCIVGSTLNVDETAEFVNMAKKYDFDSVKYNPNMYVDDEDMDYLSLVHEQEKTVRKFKEGYQRALELDLHTNYHRKPFQVESNVSVPRSSDVSAAQVFVNRMKRMFRNELAWRVENTWKQSGGKAPSAFYLAGIKARDKVIDLTPLINTARKETPFPHVVPNDAPPRSCGNPWTHIHIKSDGLVYPCCFSDEVMGDMRKEPIQKIWNNDKYQDLRRSLTDGDYWASCRKASCNWVEGSHSSIYSAAISVPSVPKTINGTAGELLAVSITNTSKFGWNPSVKSKEESTSSFKELLASADEKMIERNTRDARVTLSYRLLTMDNDLIDEGDHIPVPEDTHKEKTIEMQLPIRPVLYSGPVQMKIDLVHEGVTWFSERSNSALELELTIDSVPFSAYLSTWNKAACAKALNQSLTPGDELTLPIRIRNVGTEVLGGYSAEDFLASHWKNLSGETVEWEGARLRLSDPIQPGETKDVELTVNVPSNMKTERYHLEIDLVRNDLFWLSEAWHRPLLAWPVRVIAHEKEAAQLSDRDEHGKLFTFEAFGQCVANAGNKGIW